jgi:hypothetical protein
MPTAIRSGQAPHTATHAPAIPAEDAQRALLTLGHLSAQFKVDDDNGSDDGGNADWGCLTPESGSDAASEAAEISFSAKREPGLPGVFNSVATDAPSEASAQQAFDALAAKFRECTSVHTHSDGTDWAFDVVTDTKTWAPGADQQINIVALGTVGMTGATFPLDIRMSLVRVGDVATTVGFFDLSDTPRETRAAHQRLIGAATARLRAVIDGDPLPPTRPLLEDYEFSNILEKLKSSTQEA